MNFFEDSMVLLETNKYTIARNKTRELIVGKVFLVRVIKVVKALDLL